MFTSFDKAITSGVVSAVVMWLSYYGVTLNPLLHDTLSSLVLAAVTYLVAHIAVYLVPNVKKGL